MSSDPDLRHPIEELAEQFLDCYRRGERPAVGDFTQRYPDRASEIHDLFAALVLLEEAGKTGRSTDSPSRPDAAGGPATERLGHYRILREVGRGSMGVVYEAVQEQLGRFVALKVLPRELANKPIYRLRFQREAQAAARLHHTLIVPIFDIGEQDGTPYYAMQFIAGRPLDLIVAELRDQRLAAAFATTDTKTPDLKIGSPRYHRGMARIALQVAEALAYAHENGVIHRDIKPANILLDEKGTARLTDFGLAKDEFGDPSGTGNVAGTLRYMAPERFAGQSDPSGDVYALGVTLYELVTLQPPFAILDRDQLIHQILSDEPERPSELDPSIPRDLEVIVLKAMAKDSAQRYATAEELADDLACFLADRPILARRESWSEQARRWLRRNPVVGGLSAAVLGLLIGLIGLFMSAYLHEKGLNTKLKIAKNDSAIRKTEAEGQRDRAQRHSD